VLNNQKKLSDYESLWQWTKDRSSYHFDSFKQDTPGTLFAVVKQFPVTWQHHIETIRNQGSTRTWNNITRSGGAYKHRVLAIDKRARDIANGGGNIDKIELTDIIDDFSAFPELQEIINSFKFKKTQARCHIQRTGQMFTQHIDPLHRMFADHSETSSIRDPDPDLEDYGYDTNDIVRATVMLEDWQPGQFMIYGNTVYQQWRAGDCHFFDWKNVPHATANASEHTRITLQVTGLRTHETDPLLDIRNFKRHTS
jgi:hypothetical protein